MKRTFVIYDDSDNLTSPRDVISNTLPDCKICIALSGEECIKNTIKLSSSKKIPVVVLTTSSENNDIKTAYELGTNSYFVKPVNFDKFIEVAPHIESYWNVLNKPHFLTT